MSSLYLALCIDDLALAAARLGGALSPCVVVENRHVIAADAEAENLGILAGQSADTALALANIQLSPRCRNTERSLMRASADWAYRHSSWVHCHDQHLIMEVGGSLKLFGDLETLWQRMQTRVLHRIGRCRMGLGPSPAAALQFATLEWQTLDVEQTREWLPNIPLHSLPLETPLLLKLQGMGLKTVGELMAFSGADLARRFPLSLIDYLQRLLGQRPDPRPLWQPREHFDAWLHLQQPCRTSTALIFPLRHLLEQFEDYLKARQLQCTQLSVTVRQENRSELTLRIDLGGGSNQLSDLLEPLKIKLPTLALSDRVGDLRLQSRSFQAWHAQTPDLMAPQSQDTQTSLLNALRARLGDDALLGLSCNSGWVPEDANQINHWGAQPDQHHSTPLIRPTWLLNEPRPLSQQQVQQMHCVRGPERIESRWWHNQGVRRDYQVAWHNGTLMWVYQDLRTNAWYLHGLFA